VVLCCILLVNYTVQFVFSGKVCVDKSPNFMQKGAVICERSAACLPIRFKLHWQLASADLQIIFLFESLILCSVLAAASCPHRTSDMTYVSITSYNWADTATVASSNGVTPRAGVASNVYGWHVFYTNWRLGPRGSPARQSRQVVI